jgi:hypothetical protein
MRPEPVNCAIVRSEKMVEKAKSTKDASFHVPGLHPSHLHLPLLSQALCWAISAHLLIAWRIMRKGFSPTLSENHKLFECQSWAARRAAFPNCNNEKGLMNRIPYGLRSKLMSEGVNAFRIGSKYEPRNRSHQLESCRMPRVKIEFRVKCPERPPASELLILSDHEILIVLAANQADGRILASSDSP